MKTKYEAQKGGNGDSFNKTGVGGDDLILDFPPGTELVEHETEKAIVIPTSGEPILLCNGGRGGFGNDHFKTSINRSPRQFEPGGDGEKRTFKVLMKLIAQVGLIGLPNAGKSSLLNALTKAQARIANYPFTTLEPNLGALGRIIIADIPGLIEGASQGKGLGSRFLKHIEKVNILLHCISCEDNVTQIKKNYKAVRNELGTYNKSLLEKEEIILLTKSDLILPKERDRKIASFLKLASIVVCVSIHDIEALEKVKEVIK